MSQRQSKYWCWTLNNPTEAEEQAIKIAATEEKTPIAYLVYGREVGSSGTRHLQGYLELRRKLRLVSAKRVLGPERAHLEPRMGSASQAADYCKKDGDVVEYGTCSVPQQGKRNDLEALKETIDSGGNLRDVAEEHFGQFLRYERAIKAYLELRSVPRSWKTRVRIFWGPTGVGKTRRAVDLADGDFWIYSSDGWFDGYLGQQTVIFDDFGGHEFKLTYLLKLLDRYPMRVRIKGGFVNWCPLEVIITSNIDPEEWYPNAKPESKAALFRRFDEIIYCPDPLFDDINV